MEDYIIASSSKVCDRNFRKSISELKRNYFLFDVTLACSDGSVQCHRLVLCAFSPVFCQIFTDNSHPHPYLYFKGMQLRNLTSLLNFMYDGQVTICRKEIKAFMEIAEEFKINELVDSNNLQQQAEQYRVQIAEIPCMESVEDSMHSLDEEFYFPPDQNSHDSTSINSASSPEEDNGQIVFPPNPYSVPDLSLIVSSEYDRSYYENSSRALRRTDINGGLGESIRHFNQDSSSSNSEFIPTGDETTLLLQKSIDGYYFCTLCWYASKKRWHVKRHVQTHELRREICNVCGKSFKNKNTLLSHKYQAHTKIDTGDELERSGLSPLVEPRALLVDDASCVLMTEEKYVPSDHNANFQEC